MKQGIKVPADREGPASASSRCEGSRKSQVAFTGDGGVQVTMTITIPPAALRGMLEAVAGASPVVPSQAVAPLSGLRASRLDEAVELSLEELIEAARLRHLRGLSLREIQTVLRRSPKTIARSLWRWVTMHAPEAAEVDIDALLGKSGYGGAKTWNYLMARWGRQLPELPDEVKATLPKGEEARRKYRGLYETSRRLRESS